jgi:predicted Zn-dependent protease
MVHPLRQLRLALLVAGLFVCPGVFAQRPMRSSRSQAIPGKDLLVLHRALDAYDAGDAVTAEPLLRDLYHRYPDNYEAAEALGGLYAEANDLPRALPLLQHAAELAPRQSLAVANLGAAYLKLSRVPDALRELQRAVVLDTGSAGTQNNLGQALMLSHQPGPAVQAFRAASASSPDNEQIRYNLALALYTSGSAAEAAKVLSAIPAAETTDQVNALAGDANEKAGHFEEALARFEAAAHQNPSEANLYALSVELLRHWNWAEAIKVADFSKQLLPESATRFRLVSGIAYYGKGDYKQAVEIFSDLLHTDPDNAAIADLLGHSCGALSDGENIGCNAVYEFAQRHPGNAVMTTYAAIALLHAPGNQNNLDKAESLLKSAIDRNPDYGEAWLRMGMLQQVELKWADSATSLEHAVAINSESPEAHYRLSRAYAHLGRGEDAQAETVLYKSWSEKAKASLNTRMQEVMQFVLTPA